MRLELQLLTRIIPARAGFTHDRRRAGARLHGSSPLARGLPGPEPALPTGRRIIPARAGFTTTPRAPRGRTRDHPRSRGVYRAARPASCMTGGSSPLARGLPTPSVGFRSTTRIIPARAGFTDEAIPPFYEGWDHPRSRGVYPAAQSAVLAPPGIIPARAGFTSRRGPRRRRAPDHPRSRGVYPAPHYHRRVVPGSSPLARGLPVRFRSRAR